jgi:hypothetical protein
METRQRKNKGIEKELKEIEKTLVVIISFYTS